MIEKIKLDDIEKIKNVDELNTMIERMYKQQEEISKYQFLIWDAIRRKGKSVKIKINN